MPTVFVSDAVGHERLAFGVAQQWSSPTLRRWKALSALYQAGLVACQFGVENVLRPEIYQTDVARQVRGVCDGDWHLSVKPIEHIRPFHGILNVFVCDWPFSELSSSRRGGSPFSDQVGLLNRAHAVACSTPFTARSLRAAGVERVVDLPPYIPMGGGMVGPVRRAVPARRRFLAVADIDRMPRQLGPMIRGLTEARARHGDLQLTVRVMGDGRQPSADVRREVLGSVGLDGTDGAISFVFDTDASVANLLGSVDFFLCCDAVGGLSLSLVEAMMAGVPLLTTMTSATGSFLIQGCAVPIPTVTVVADEIDDPMARFMKLGCDVPTASGIRDAILAAVDLDDATCTTMTTACRQIADRNFGIAAFRAGLMRIEELLGQRDR